MLSDQVWLKTIGLLIFFFIAIYQKKEKKAEEEKTHSLLVFNSQLDILTFGYST